MKGMTLSTISGQLSNVFPAPEMAWSDYLRPRLTPARPARAPKIAETNPPAIS